MSASPASNWPCHQSLECRNLHLQPHHTLGCTDLFISFQQHLSTQNLFAEWNFFLTPDAFYDQNPEFSKSHSYGNNIKMSHPKTKREPEQGTSLAWQLTNGNQELIPTSARTDYIWPLYTTPAKGYLETNHCRIWQSLGCKTSLPCGLPFHGLNTRKWGLCFRVVSVW